MNTVCGTLRLVVKMRKLHLDSEKSKEVYKLCEKNIKCKCCYNNIFEVVTMYMSNFRAGKWKVAYGYVEVMPMLYCRHCFILDDKGTVVDPTIFTQSEPPLEREYLVMFVFDDTDEYLTAIESDDLMPALEKYLREQDKQAIEWAKNNGLILVG